MNNATWQQAKDIFDEARHLYVAERAAFLDKACSANQDLRNEVEKLLSSYDSDFLERGGLRAAEVLIRPDLVTGQIIGRYRIKKLIGTGGMGQVFLADDTELDRPVAFKVLHADVAEDQERVRRFIQEARAASALNHPNIITIHEIGSIEGSRFIVSEYVDGETLRERMQNGLTVAQSVDITCQIAAALKAAHAAGIVHRDIKPENVMLRADGLVKVLDFGLAKLTEADDLPIDPNARPASRVHTSPGLVMGTVAYMSPEQARGQAVDSRTDLWSLGVVFHEMLTGKSPFEGESVTELVTSILSSDGTPANTDGLPPELTPICQKALTKDREHRYQSAHDLLNDLQGEQKRMEYAIQPTPFISSSSTDELKTQVIRRRPTLSAEYIVSSVKRHKYATLGTLALVIMGAVGLSVYRYNGATPSSADRSVGIIGEDTTEKDLKISKFPSSGKVFEIAISPDGKFVAYLSGENYRANIHVRELATQNDVEIVPAPASEKLWRLNSLTFTPDGSRLLYRHDTESKSEIYSIGRSGGSPIKFADDVRQASISPDGKTIAFHKNIDEVEGGSNQRANDIVLANVDGTNERPLVHTVPKDDFVGTGVPSWSPDGKWIVCWFGFTENGREYYKLAAINTADGSKRSFSDKRWADISGTVWMPDGSLIITAQEYPSEQLAPSQLWRVTEASARAITNDPAGYDGLSGTRDGSVLVTTQSTVRRDLWVMNGGDATTARQITFSGELSLQGFGGFSPLSANRIVLSSTISNNVDLWSMNLDGSGRKQLTAGQGINLEPHATADGRVVIFNSDRGGTALHVFRMDADGGNLKQLTEKDDSRCIGLTPDGKWVYYQIDENGGRSLYKVSIDGGPSSLVAKVNIKGSSYDVSPSDGRIAEMISSPELKSSEVNIYSRDGSKLKNIRMPPTAVGPGIRWTPDGKAVGFHDFQDKATNIWVMPVDGKGQPKPLTNFTAPITADHGWSADGKQLFVVRITHTDDAIMITNTRN